MHIDKARKRIVKLVKRGFKGYPQIGLSYFGTVPECANQVLVRFTLEEGGEVQEQRFDSKSDAREDETIQTSLVKIIERANAATVLEDTTVIINK